MHGTLTVDGETADAALFMLLRRRDRLGGSTG
jgi:hypothetical protein